MKNKCSILSLKRTQALPLAVVVASLMLSAGARADFVSPMTLTPTIMANPGEYSMIDRTKIETQLIDWARLGQSQDQATYQRITAEAEAAYKDLYASFNQLRQLHIDTVVAKKGATDMLTLSSAIMTYITKRDLLAQKLAVIGINRDVWANMAGTDKSREPVYKAGQLNLEAFAKTYADSLATMDRGATEFTYQYRDNIGTPTTRAGEGLRVPNAQDTPESLAKQIEDLRHHGEFTPDETEDTNNMIIEVGRTMVSFVNAEGIRLYWLNKNQEGERKSWVDSIQHKARVLQFVRGAYCMQLGVPAIAIPTPKKFNLDYIKRGVTPDMFRIVQKAEHDGNAIRTTLFAFDQLFTSLQSQGGEFNSEGGLMSYVNRINSTFTWHNEVHAYLSVLKILREGMIDELDLKDGQMGCDKVRARYVARYGKHTEDKTFVKSVNDLLGGGASFGNKNDPFLNAFRDAGKPILTKGAYVAKALKIQRDNPGTTLLERSLEDLGL